MKLKKDEDLYSKVTQYIKKVRDQGDSPKSDLFSLDSYICDLCKGVATKENITQCSFCGRWVCRKNCWDFDFKACSSCVGVIKLCKESVTMETKRTKIITSAGIKPGKKIKKSKLKSLLKK